MIATTAGWIGFAGVFAAYILVTRGRLQADSWRCGLLNTVGGVLGGVAAAAYGAWPSATSNFIWAVVGGLTVASAARKRRTLDYPVPC